ncbi:hypothetical protein ACH4D5_25345 [Streptomyces sp. NPDC018029]|uniref:hypothetical protein n=1 Tax=Streptomyces sp. NPDC018029 TaxID=3365032 RepID=UPI0037AC9E08
MEVPAPRPDDDPYATLATEAGATAFHRKFGVCLPRLPGYSITRAEADKTLLRERHGLPLGCFKPAEALTGSRIRVAVPLADDAALDALADQAMETDEDCVLEAHTHYLRQRVPGYEFILAPPPTWWRDSSPRAARCRSPGQCLNRRRHLCPVRHHARAVPRRAAGHGATVRGIPGAGARPQVTKGGVDFPIAHLGGRAECGRRFSPTRGTCSTARRRQGPYVVLVEAEPVARDVEEPHDVAVFHLDTLGQTPEAWMT